jgi:DNA-directed RNA polymerase specialized sigma24 family protein
LEFEAVNTIPALDQITTRWSQIRDPLRFVMRYSPAIRAYLAALFRDDDAAEEACQEFLARFLERGLIAASPDRGRFRDYLKMSVRNTAIAMLRAKRARPVDPALFEALLTTAADNAWAAHWRRVVLDKAWRMIEAHEHAAPTSLYYTALRLTVDHQNESSEQLAARAAAQANRSITPAAFRKQLSRARQFFAEAIVEEVSQTLSGCTHDELQGELAELGLLPYVRDFLDFSETESVAVTNGLSARIVT